MRQIIREEMKQAVKEEKKVNNEENDTKESPEKKEPDPAGNAKEKVNFDDLNLDLSSKGTNGVMM